MVMSDPKQTQTTDLAFCASCGRWMLPRFLLAHVCRLP
jgi:hypothetical protein